MSLLKQDLDVVRSAEGLNTSLVDAISKLGNSGANPGNMHKELVALVGSETKLMKPHRLSVPMKHSTHGFFRTDMDMILPHELFAYIYRFYPQQFIKYLVPSTEILQEFWQDVQVTCIVLQS